MDINLPLNVKDTNEFRHAWNQLLDWCRRNTLRSSNDIKITQTANGTTLEIVDKIKQKYNQGGGTSAPSGNTNWNYRGLYSYSPPSPYMIYDVVQTGNGFFISTINSNPNSPTSGLGWINVNGGSLGYWV
jgi:hypothetical protein